GHHEGELQIVMRLEERPVTPVRLENLELQSGTPKGPPSELELARVVDPVRLEPLRDVVVAGEEDGLPGGPAPRLLEREGADAGDLPVDDGRGLGDDAREVGAEALAVRQDLVRSQPGGDGAEADGRERSGHLVEGSAGRDRVD